MITKEAVLNALSNVQEPDLGKDLVSLNMVTQLAIEGKEIRFVLLLTTPACPMKDIMRRACENAIHYLVDPEAIVHIDFSTLPKKAPPVVAHSIRQVVGVFSGKGGVGKSTIAAGLALGLASKAPDLKVGLMDADIFGPSVPLMFDMQGQRPHMEAVAGQNKILPLHKYGIALMSIGFLMDEQQAAVWRGPMASNAVRQFITDVAWGELDYLVVDMPPGTSDIHLTALQHLSMAGALIVSTPQQVALSDARRAITMFHQMKTPTPIVGVVENMAYLSVPQAKAPQYVFGREGAQQLAKECKLPFLGALPLIPDICAYADAGRSLMEIAAARPIFESIAEKVVRVLAMHDHKRSPDEILDALQQHTDNPLG